MKYLLETFESLPLNIRVKNIKPGQKTEDGFVRQNGVIEIEDNFFDFNTGKEITSPDTNSRIKFSIRYDRKLKEGMYDLGTAKRHLVIIPGKAVFVTIEGEHQKEVLTATFEKRDFNKFITVRDNSGSIKGEINTSALKKDTGFIEFMDHWAKEVDNKEDLKGFVNEIIKSRQNANELSDDLKSNLNSLIKNSEGFKKLENVTEDLIYDANSVFVNDDYADRDGFSPATYKAEYPAYEINGEKIVILKDSQAHFQKRIEGYKIYVFIKPIVSYEYSSGRFRLNVSYDTIKSYDLYDENQVKADLATYFSKYIMLDGYLIREF